MSRYKSWETGSQEVRAVEMAEEDQTGCVWGGKGLWREKRVGVSRKASFWLLLDSQEGPSPEGRRKRGREGRCPSLPYPPKLLCLSCTLSPYPFRPHPAHAPISMSEAPSLLPLPASWPTL